MSFSPRKLQRIALAGSIVLTASCSLFVDVADLQGGGDAGPGGSDAGGDVSTLDASSDGSKSTDGATNEDAGPACDPAAPFDEVHLVGSFADEGYALFKATLTGNELEGWVAVSYPADASVPDEIVHSTLLPDGGYISSDTPDIDDAVDPAVTYDGKTMIYSAQGSVGAFDLFLSHRPSGTGSFAPGVQLDNVQSTTSDVSPFIDTNGGLWFASDRDESSFKLDIFHASPDGSGGFEVPARRTELDSNGSTSGIVLTSDQLTAYVTSDRTDLTSLGGRDVFRATRANTSDAFGALTNETEINSSGNERASWISPNNCHLYLETDKDFGITEIYLATKTPK